MLALWLVRSFTLWEGLGERSCGIMIYMSLIQVWKKLVNIMFSVANFFISIFSQFPNKSNSLFLQIVKKSAKVDKCSKYIYWSCLLSKEVPSRSKTFSFFFTKKANHFKNVLMPNTLGQNHLISPTSESLLCYKSNTPFKVKQRVIWKTASYILISFFQACFFECIWKNCMHVHACFNTVFMCI